MFNKIFKRGVGIASGIDYLLSPTDSTKKIRAVPPILMRGDAKLTKTIINSINYKQKYTSGVISMSESPGEISEKVLHEIMDSFESMVTTGIDQDRLNWLWVQHQDKGRIELHYVSPTIDLKSGKRFSHYYDRADRLRFRAWERYTNLLYGFTDPSDPSRKRDLRIPLTLPSDKTQAINELHCVVTALITQGSIDCRADIIKHLELSGYMINRVTKEFISIKDQAGRKLRLRGALYESDFSSIQSNNIRKKASLITEADRSTRLTQLKEALNKEIDKRSRYISNRFASSYEINNKSLRSNSIIEGIKHDRNSKSFNQFSKKNGAGIDQKGGATDEALQRVASALADVEQRSAELKTRLTYIKYQFTRFIVNFSEHCQRLKTNIYKSNSVKASKFKY